MPSLSKRYTITLSKPEDKIYVDLGHSQDPLAKAGDDVVAMQKVRGEYSTREAEVGLLTAIFTAAGNSKEDLKKSALCFEIVDRLENLGDETEIELTDQDVENINDGWKKLANNRGGVASRLSKLIVQLANPKEVVPETKVVE